GGRNLGDAYFGQGRDSNFVDLDVLAAGPVVTELSRSFDAYWNDPLAYPVQTLMTPADIAALRKTLPGKAPSPATDAATLPNAADSARTAGSMLADGPSAPSAASAPSQPGSATATVSEAQAASPLGALAVPTLLDMKRLPLTWAPAIVLADHPNKIEGDETDPEPTLVEGLVGLMERAQKDVLIVSPYFVPGERMMKVLTAMREKQVRIRVLTNSLASNDAPLAHAGYARYRQRLLAIGVELHEMRTEQLGRRSAFGSSMSGSAGAASGGSVGGSGDGGSLAGGSRASLHSKVIVLDQRVVVIGSMNLDLRSELQNSEIALLIRSAALAKNAAEVIEPTMASGAYRVELRGGRLLWLPPAGSGLAETTIEPDATLGLRLLLKVIGPLAPEEML
ncbi:MAG: phospholipase, partial [Rhodoferax sp.]|nr:phospholipase [Rhodoferax sp.]